MVLRRSIALFALCLWGLPAAASAQAGDLGPAADGLPGAWRVGFANEAPARLTVQGTGGYGFIEGAGAEGGDHHRVAGGLGVAIRPLEWLSFSLGAQGRWDVHPDDDSGFGAPWLAARAGWDLADEFALGFDVRFVGHGEDAPSIDFLGSRLSLRGLFTARPTESVRLGLHAGLRLDGTGRTVDRSGAVQFGPGDQVSLAVTDSDAALIGLAGAIDFGGVELLLEATWEPLFGDAAPSLERSPLRFGVGARAELVTGLALGAMIELTAQPREAVVFSQLVEVEPRVQAMLSLSYRFDFDGDEETAAEEGDDGPDEVDDAPEGTRRVSGRVTDADGAPLAAADVRIVDEAGGELARGTSDPQGAFALDVPEDATGTVEVSAEGYDAYSAPLGGGAAPLSVGLSPTQAVGTLRGLVRSFAGRAVEATVSVDGGEPTQTDEDGVFEVEVTAGAHTVEVTADGYATQQREIQVEPGGVTILNVDLRRQR